MTSSSLAGKGFAGYTFDKRFKIPALKACTTKCADDANYKPPAESSSPHHSGRFMWALADVITSQSLLGNCYIMRSV